MCLIESIAGIFLNLTKFDISKKHLKFLQLPYCISNFTVLKYPSSADKCPHVKNR